MIGRFLPTALQDDYFTTSSCSGRACLFQSSARSKGGTWPYMTHAEADISELMAAVATLDSSNTTSAEFRYDLRYGPLAAGSDLRQECPAYCAKVRAVYPACGGTKHRVGQLPVCLASSPECCQNSREYPRVQASRLQAIALQAGFRESGLSMYALPMPSAC